MIFRPGQAYPGNKREICGFMVIIARILKQRDREKLPGLLCGDIVVTYHASQVNSPGPDNFMASLDLTNFFRIIEDHLNVINVDVIASAVAGNRVINQCEEIREYKNTGHVVKGGMVNVFTVEAGKITGYEVYADTAAFAASFCKTTTAA